MQLLSSVLFVIYLATLVFMGVKHSKKDHTMESYWMADRNLSAMRIAFCLAASWFGLSSFTGQAGWIYAEGLGALWYLAIPNIAAILLIGTVFIKHIRRIPAISQPEFLEMRYDKRLRPWLALIILLAFSGFAAMEYIALGYVFKNFMGWSPVIGGIFIVVSTMIYVSLGGMTTVVWTEVVQFICLLVVGLVIGVVALMKGAALVPSGETLTTVQHLDGANWWSFLSIGVFNVFILIIAYWPGFATEQDPWQRIWMAKDTKNAYKGALLGVAFIFIAYACSVMMAIGAWGVLGAPGPDTNVEESVFALMQNTLPWWFISIAVVGFVAAAMSNISTFSTSAASNLTKDWYQRLLRPHASQKELVVVSRILIAVCLSLGILVGTAIPKILDVLFLSATIATTGYFVPIMGALYWRRANTQGAIAAIILGGGSNIVFFALQTWANMEFPVDPVLISVTISFLAFVIVSYATNPPSIEKLLCFFPNDAVTFIGRWKAEQVNCKADTDTLSYVKQNLVQKEQGERVLLEVYLKIENTEFSSMEKWQGFINKVLNNSSWVWLSGYDIVYKIVTKDMLGNPRLTRGNSDNEILIYCEPLKEEMDSIISYMAVAIDDVKIVAEHASLKN